jgi:hypothetical protein
MIRNMEHLCLCKFICVLLLQVVIFESRVKTPQVGLYALAKALTQKGVAKKIQVPVLTLSVSSVQDVYGSLLFPPLKIYP